MKCKCPLKGFVSIDTPNCPADYGQAQRLIFVQTDAANIFDTASGAFGAAVQKACTASKALMTPYIENPSMEVGEAQTYGGGNETLNGAERIIGRNPSKFTCVLNGFDNAQGIKQIKELQCHAAAHNLSVFFVMEGDRIIGKDKGDGATPVGIPVESLFISDQKIGTYGEPPQNNISFNLERGWSDEIFSSVSKDKLTSLMITGSPKGK